MELEKGYSPFALEVRQGCIPFAEEVIEQVWELEQKRKAA